jgi:hypothetical protein
MLYVKLGNIKKREFDVIKSIKDLQKVDGFLHQYSFALPEWISQSNIASKTKLAM